MYYLKCICNQLQNTQLIATYAKEHLLFTKSPDVGISKP